MEKIKSLNYISRFSVGVSCPCYTKAFQFNSYSIKCNVNAQGIPEIQLKGTQTSLNYCFICNRTSCHGEPGVKGIVGTVSLTVTSRRMQNVSTVFHQHPRERLWLSHKSLDDLTPQSSPKVTSEYQAGRHWAPLLQSSQSQRGPRGRWAHNYTMIVKYGKAADREIKVGSEKKKQKLKMTKA